jgi:hypothetical protein
MECAGEIKAHDTLGVNWAFATDLVCGHSRGVDRARVVAESTALSRQHPSLTLEHHNQHGPNPHRFAARFFPLPKSCSLLVHPEVFSNTNPQRVVLRGFVFSASYLGGRRWYRTTDPLLVSYGQDLSLVPVYSRLTYAFNWLEPLAFRNARGYSGLFWRLLCTSVHHKYTCVGQFVEVSAMGPMALSGSRPVGPVPSPTYDQITPYP